MLFHSFFVDHFLIVAGIASLASAQTAPGLSSTLSTATSARFTNSSTIVQGSSSGITTSSSSLPVTLSSSSSLPSSSGSGGAPPFIVPTVTSRVSVSLAIPTAVPTQGPAGGVTVTNPDNPSESVAFGVITIPEDQRVGLPDATDAAPLALLLLGFAFPVLLFSGFTVVAPIAAPGVLAGAGAWLALSQFPTPDILRGNDNGGDNNDDNAPSSTGDPRTTSAPTSSSSASSTSSSSSSSSSSSTSSAPNGLPTQYIIFPKSGNGAQVEELSANLTRDLGADKVFSSFGTGGVDFWSAPMSPQYAEEIKSKSFIDAIGVDSAFVFDDVDSWDTPSKRSVSDQKAAKSFIHPPSKRQLALSPRALNSDGYEVQGPVDEQLSIISFTFIKDKFYYRPSAGQGVTIYIVDTGVSRDAIKGHSIPASDYIYGGFLPVPPPTADDGHTPGHGTCVAAMAADEEFGVAKKAKIRPVKMRPKLLPDGEIGVSFELSSIVSAYNNILADIKENKKKGDFKAVINLSGFFRPQTDALFPNGLDAAKKVLQDIMAQDVPFIAASGNFGDPNLPPGNPNFSKDISMHPQLWDAPDFPIINVGAVDRTGKHMSFSQGGTHLHVNAVGDRVKCRAKDGSERIDSGTSFAAPQVAGLAAYFLSLQPGERGYKQFTQGNVAKEMKQHIISLSRSLKSNDVEYPNVIFNDAEEDVLGCLIPKRQAGGGDGPACSRPSSVSTVPSTLLTIPSTSVGASSTIGSSSTTSNSLTTISTISQPSSSSVSSASASATPSGTLNCQQNIPSGGPAPSHIASAIRGANDNGLNQICDARFDGSGDANQMTFNHGSLTISVRRTDTSKLLQYCRQSILTILQTCVLGSNDYGGILNVSGEAYNITNIIWPQNPLIPGTDQGAPSITPAPSSTQAGPPPIRTITTNGQICTLIQGSLHPVCRPETTPTPNPAGTNIHVESGCIAVNGSPRCSGNSETEVYNIAMDTQKEPWFTAIIYGQFNPDDHTWGNVRPGCKMNARWPGNYGDIYVKSDFCLYDAGGNKIWDQCCTISTTDQITNPYGRQEILTCDCVGIPFFDFCIGVEVGNGCGLFRKK